MYFILLQRLFENLSYHADVRGRVEAWRFVAGHWRVINEQFHASVVFCLVSIGLKVPREVLILRWGLNPGPTAAGGLRSRCSL